MNVLRYPPMIIMGVQGTGKTTIGESLAARLNVTFIDGDDLHPAANKAKMREGIPLDDEDRLPWLKRIGEVMREQLAEGHITIVACSALKRWYRELLRNEVPGLFFVHLTGDRALLAERLAARSHEYMPTTLLDSQIATLQPLAPWEEAAVIDIDQTPAQIVDEVQHLLQRRVSAAS